MLPQKCGYLGGNVTRASICEYAAAVRPRYQRARREERSGILDEFCQTTGYHRKAAIRLLNRADRAKAAKRGRPKVYDRAIAEALVRVWEASDRLCSKRLVPFLPTFLEALERHQAIVLAPAERDQLRRLSPATVDRLLGPYRRNLGRRPYTSQSGAAVLRAHVPVRTFGEWQEVTAGAVQADLVAHCGESAEGFFLTSLCAVDVATGWTEVQEVWGRGQEQVRGAIHQARQRFPFPLRELHTDNGSEFLNHVLVPYCRTDDLRLTRGRPYRKNDQAYVEQRNGAVIRRLIGYDRSTSKAAHAQLRLLDGLVRLWVNYFAPLRKVIAKERSGAKVVKQFDAAQTPYQRVVAAGILAADKQVALAREFRLLNPIALRGQIEQELERLWTLAERKAPTGAAGAASGGGAKP